MFHLLLERFLVVFRVDDLVETEPIEQSDDLVMFPRISAEKSVPEDHSFVIVIVNNRTIVQVRHFASVRSEQSVGRTNVPFFDRCQMKIIVRVFFEEMHRFITRPGGGDYLIGNVAVNVFDELMSSTSMRTRDNDLVDVSSMCLHETVRVSVDV